MRKSIVADLIDYDANPSWKKMIHEIIEIKQKMPHELTYAITTYGRRLLLSLQCRRGTRSAV